MFFAKLLLFGEYLLLHGAPALAVPIAAFGGDWAWSGAGETPDVFAERLQAFAESENLRSISGLDVAAFAEDLQRGLYFSSTIPVGYGLGSSGALVAAVYARYYRGAVPADLKLLQNTLAGLERFFHGSSSGIDPLTSFVGQPLLLTTDRVERFAGRAWTEAPVVFLLDTEQPRQTRPLVEWFAAQRGTASFVHILETALIPAHKTLLDAWQRADHTAFWPALERFSALQRRYLQPMVAGLDTLWGDALTQHDFYLKLCGAGGGGFALGFARSRNALAGLSARYRLYFPFEPYDLEG